MCIKQFNQNGTGQYKLSYLFFSNCILIRCIICRFTLLSLFLNINKALINETNHKLLRFVGIYKNIFTKLNNYNL